MTASPPLHTLDELFDTFAARGDRTALVAFGASGALTIGFAALHEDIERLAAALQRRGVVPGEMVLLWAPNGLPWVSAYFAILLCGATVIPLDNQTSEQRAAAVLAHSGAKHALTTAAHAETLAAHEAAANVTCVRLDGDEAHALHWRSLEAANLERAAPDRERVASLLYTSGTTGTPKAVPLTHGNLAANVTALLGAQLVTADDVVLVPLPFHHVYPFTVGLLTVLATGASIVLPAGISGPDITRAAAESGATALIAVPRLCAAVWEGIERGVRGRGKRAQKLFFSLLRLSRWLRRHLHVRIGKLLFRSVHEKIGPRLRTIGCGGAQLDAELAHNLEGLGWTVLTGYGLTETSPVLTFNQHSRRKLGSEGVPLPGVEVATRPQPEFEHGEIVARGPSVFGGYWNNPAETRNAFTDDGWFKTGDLGWLDPEGYLHIAGRSKEVIVLPDGKNVYPDEIEDEFAASTLVAELAVLEHEGQLRALVVPDDQAVRDRGAHRVEEMIKDEMAGVSSRLPPYQRIRDFRITRTPLPRTPLGKLRRHLLGEAYADAAKRKVETKAPSLSEDDRALLAEEPAASVWTWLQARYPDHTLALDTSPQLDLNIDSLEWVTLTLEIEREFHVALDGDAVSRIVTLRDFLAEIQRAPHTSPEETAARQAGALEHPNVLLRALGFMLYGLNRLLLRTIFKLRSTGTQTLPPADASFVIAPNHVSYLDALAIAAALPRPHLRNLWWAGWAGVTHAGPLLRLVSRSTHVFPIEPDRDPSGALALGRTVLGQRHILVWFPEGRRSWDGTLQRFQAGLGLLVHDANVAAVPTAIIGAFEAWPRNARRPRPAPIHVVFGRPYSRDELLASGRGNSDAERIADALHTAVADLLRRSEFSRDSRAKNRD